MKKEDKSAIIEQIGKTLNEYGHFYLADTADLNAAETSQLRKDCYKADIKLLVVKNTLLEKAFDKSEVDFSQLYSVLKGQTSLMLCNTGNAPAILIQEFSKKSKKKKPALKAAYVEEIFYIGENHLGELVNIKSKNELIADIVAMLQSPAKNVISALQSGGNTIHGVLQTLAEK
ncbi:MAG: 50S ribosomal protein L10 [Prevotellaceae bacterium]|jgi:large subunit ribosomal protein L10|nr:50S ribosomal protein L10 [Prevotellaceae bacterium]